MIFFHLYKKIQVKLGMQFVELTIHLHSVGLFDLPYFVLYTIHLFCYIHIAYLTNQHHGDWESDIIEYLLSKHIMTISGVVCARIHSSTVYHNITIFDHINSNDYSIHLIFMHHALLEFNLSEWT